jgi:uncharacterized protein involved in exopolysaccharide biosynthesis
MLHASDTQQAGSAARIGLPEILGFLRRYAIVVGTMAVVGAVLGFILASVLPRQYRAEATLAPVNDMSSSGGLSGMQSQLGGLASLVGLNIGGSDQRAEALEFLKSKQLVRNFIREQDLMPVLFAKKWDSASKQWRNPQKAPTENDAVTYFSKKVLRVGEDKRSGMVKLSVNWRDREQAAHWATLLVGAANDTVRQRAIEETTQRVKFLTQEGQRTNVIGVKEATFRLVENQLNRAMVARTSAEYAFRVIDPPVVPDADDHYFPRRGLLTAGGALGGLFLGLVFTLLFSTFRSAWAVSRQEHP